MTPRKELLNRMTDLITKYGSVQAASIAILDLLESYPREVVQEVHDHSLSKMEEFELAGDLLRFTGADTVHLLTCTFLQVSILVDNIVDGTKKEEVKKDYSDMSFGGPLI